MPFGMSYNSELRRGIYTYRGLCATVCRVIRSLVATVSEVMFQRT